MKQKALIGVVLGILLVVGVGAFVILNRKTTSSTNIPVTQPVAEGQNEVVPTEKKSLRDLLNLGVSQQCSFSDPDSGTEGKAYVANQKVRTDFITTTSSAVINSHAIITGDKMYLWMDGQTTGYVMSIESASPSPESSVNMNKQVDYNCSSWTADNSVFTLPTTVKFQDLNSLMQTPQATSEGSTTLDCSSCDNLPKDAYDQCRASLGCE